MPIVLLWLLACAAHDPPTRSYADLPPAPARAAPVASEEELVRDVRAVYRALGLPADAVLVTLDGAGLQPLASDGVVHAARFVVEAEAARWRIEEIGRQAWGAPIELKGWSDEEIVEAWLAWNTAAIARELAHAMGDAERLPERQTGGLAELRRASDAEMPVLARLADRGRVPVSWPGAYRRLLEAALASVPPSVAAAAPSEPAAQDALIRSGDPANAAAIAWIALSYRLERARDPVPLAELPDRLAGADFAAQHVQRALELLRGEAGAELSLEPGLARLHLTGRRDELSVRYDAASRRATLSLSLAADWPAAREAELLRLLNEANAELSAGRLSQRPGALLLSSDEIGLVDASALVIEIERLERQGRPWMDAWLGMVERGLPLAEAIAGARAAEAQP